MHDCACQAALHKRRGHRIHTSVGVLVLQGRIIGPLSRRSTVTRPKMHLLGPGHGHVSQTLNTSTSLDAPKPGSTRLSIEHYRYISWKRVSPCCRQSGCDPMRLFNHQVRLRVMMWRPRTKSHTQTKRRTHSMICPPRSRLLTPVLNRLSLL